MSTEQTISEQAKRILVYNFDPEYVNGKDVSEDEEYYVKLYPQWVAEIQKQLDAFAAEKTRELRQTVASLDGTLEATNHELNDANEKAFRLFKDRDQLLSQRATDQATIEELRAEAERIATLANDRARENRALIESVIGALRLTEDEADDAWNNPIPCLAELANETVNVREALRAKLATAEEALKIGDEWLKERAEKGYAVRDVGEEKFMRALAALNASKGEGK